MDKQSFVAATLDDAELHILAQVSKSYGDTALLDEYAEWLTLKDAAKAKYIRAFSVAQSEQRGLALFDDRKFSEVVGHKLVNAIAELELQTIAKSLLSWARPIVGIETESVASEDQIAIGSSKFGGRPDMPHSMPWPVCERGPLGFAAQISFAEISNSIAAAHHELPKSGMLLFFVFDDHENGIQPGVVTRKGDKYEEIQGLSKVVYIGEKEGLHRRDPPAEAVEGNRGVSPCRLKMFDAIDIPVAEDTEDEALITHSEGIWELRQRLNNSEHWLFGYPVHSRTSNTSPGKDWMGLLTIGSDDKLGWSWCGGEHLDIFVEKESLAAHSFKKTYAYAS